MLAKTILCACGMGAFAGGWLLISWAGQVVPMDNRVLRFQMRLIGLACWALGAWLAAKWVAG